MFQKVLYFVWFNDLAIKGVRLLTVAKWQENFSQGKSGKCMSSCKSPFRSLIPNV